MPMMKSCEFPFFPASVFMARAKIKFTISLNGIVHETSGAIFREYVSLGWLVETRKRHARPAKGVDGWIDHRDRTIHLVNTEAKIGVSIPCSWSACEKARVYSERGIREAGERQRAIQEMCGPLTQKNSFSYPNVESFGSLAGNNQP